MVEEQNKAPVCADRNKLRVDRNRRWKAWAMLSLYGCILLQLAADGLHATEEHPAPTHGGAIGPIALTPSSLTFQRRQRVGDTRFEEALFSVVYLASFFIK